MTAIVMELAGSERRISGRPYSVYANNRVVDTHPTLSGARHAARMLTNGTGRVNPHALEGLRVEAVTSC